MVFSSKYGRTAHNIKTTRGLFWYKSWDLKVMLESRTIPKNLVLFFSSMVWVLYGFFSTDSFLRDFKMTKFCLLAKHQFSILFNSWPKTSGSLQYVCFVAAFKRSYTCTSIWNNKDPKFDPYGTPILTSHNSDLQLSTNTYCSQFLR